MQTPGIPEEAAKAAPACMQCGSLHILEGNPNPLCASCRRDLIRFPIPLWVKLFGLGVILLMLGSLTTVPRDFSAGIHLRRGKNAEEKKRYITARNEFEKVLDQLNSNEAKAHLMIAAFYNMDYDGLVNYGSQIADQNLGEKEDLMNRLNTMMEEARAYLPSDSLKALYNEYHGADSLPLSRLGQYAHLHTEDESALLAYASKLQNIERYAASDTIIDKALYEQPSCLEALALKINVKIELKQLDSALLYCNRMLAINAESMFALTHKARIYLRQQQLANGLALALSSYRLEKPHPYTIATLALAYHFNGKTKERDQLLKDAPKDSAAMYYIGYAEDVISGKEKF